MEIYASCRIRCGNSVLIFFLGGRTTRPHASSDLLLGVSTRVWLCMGDGDEVWTNFAYDVIDDEEAQERRREREARIRARFLEARATYKAKHDTEAWFLDGVTLENVKTQTLDTMTSQRIQMGILYMYYQHKYEEAYTWSICLLERMYAFSAGAVVWSQSVALPVLCSTSPPRDKESQAMSQSAVARETLDTALRCALHMHEAPRESLELAIAAAYSRVRMEPSAYDGLWQKDRNKSSCWVCAYGYGSNGRRTD